MCVCVERQGVCVCVRVCMRVRVCVRWKVGCIWEVKMCLRGTNSNAGGRFKFECLCDGGTARQAQAGRLATLTGRGAVTQAGCVPLLSLSVAM